VQRPRRDSVRATTNEIEFGSPNLRRNKSDYMKGTQVRMLAGGAMNLEEMPLLYEKIEMPHLQKNDFKFLEIDLDDPQSNFYL